MITLSQVAPSDASPSSPVSQGTLQAQYSLSGTQTGHLSMADGSGFTPSPPALTPSSGLGQGGQVSLTAPAGPQPTGSAPTGNGVDPTVNALIDLAASEFANSGGSITGGGGVVALPTSIDTSSTSAPASSNGKTIVVLLLIVGIGYYFYKKHSAKAA